MKKILLVSNYYYPYISGMTEYIRILAEELVERKYDVTVLTTNHGNFKNNEVINKVNVIRSKVVLKISKGTISFEFLKNIINLSKSYDIVNLHLPMIESGIFSLFINKNKLISTYQCDVNLPPSFFNNFIVKIMDISCKFCLSKSYKICATSLNYANFSRNLKSYMSKTLEMGAPIKDLSFQPNAYDKNFKTIGFLGRITEEKGLDVLVESFEIVSSKEKNCRLLIAGNYTSVAGGSVFKELSELILKKNIKNVFFLGSVNENELDLFYSKLDVFVLPSINSLEAFGMVQVESMYCGVPVVSSSLPGVKSIIEKTGMGLVSETSNYKDLAKCILDILNNKTFFYKDKNYIKSIYSTKITVECYDSLFKSIIDKKHKIL